MPGRLAGSAPYSLSQPHIKPLSEEGVRLRSLDRLAPLLGARNLACLDKAVTDCSSNCLLRPSPLVRSLNGLPHQF